MMIPFKCFSHFKIVFDHLILSFNAGYIVFLCKKCVKYRYASGSVCAYARFSETSSNDLGVC